eukprot:252409-Rhodomonas_salina.2
MGVALSQRRLRGLFRGAKVKLGNTCRVAGLNGETQQVADARGPSHLMQAYDAQPELSRSWRPRNCGVAHQFLNQ